MADEPKKQQWKKISPKGGDRNGINFPIELVLLGIGVFVVIYQMSGVFIEGARGVAESMYVLRFILALKIISGITTFIAVPLSIYIVLENNAFMRAGADAHVIAAISTKDVRSEWKEVEEHISNATDDDARYIIIEADIVLDKALQILHIPGETTGERIKYLQGQGFKYTSDLWEAHKIRNQVAHEGGNHMTYSDAVYALQKYEKVLKELGVL